MNELTLPTPSIKEAQSFDITKGGVITFNLGAGGTQFVRSSVIQFFDNTNIDMAIPVATSVYNSTSNKHIIPPNLQGLQNNKNYVITVTVFTGLDRTGDYSAQSQPMLLWCLPEPKISFKPIPEIISTTSYTMEVVFNSLDSIISNRINSYQFTLYDESNKEQQNSKVIYNKGRKQSDGTYLLTYTFTNLRNEKKYNVLFECDTEQNMKLSLFSDYIIVNVDEPISGKPNIKNNPCTGTIEITADKKSISTQLQNPNINLNFYYTNKQGLEQKENTILWNDNYTFSSIKLEVDKGKTINSIVKPMGSLGKESQYYTPHISDLSTVKVIQNTNLGTKEYYPNLQGMVENLQSINPYMNFKTDNNNALLSVSYYDDTYKGVKTQVQGKAIEIYDSSPITYKMDCQIDKQNNIINYFNIKNLTNVTEAFSKLEVQNNDIVITTDSYYTPVTLHENLQTLCPNIQVGEEYYLDFDSLGEKSIYFVDAYFTWEAGTKQYITDTMLTSRIRMYGQGDNIPCVISNFQISKQNNIQDVKLTVMGKNLLPNEKYINHRWLILGQSNNIDRNTFLEEGKTYTFLFENPINQPLILRSYSGITEIGEEIGKIDNNKTSLTFTFQQPTGYYFLFLYANSSSVWQTNDIGYFQLAQGQDNVYAPYAKNIYVPDSEGKILNMTSVGSTMLIKSNLGTIDIILNYYKTEDVNKKPIKTNLIGENIQINNLSLIPHSIDCIVLSKNIINYPYAENTLTRNGITYTVKTDGTIHVKGTATEFSYLELNNTIVKPDLKAHNIYNFNLEQETDLSNVTKLKLQKRRSDRIKDKWITIDVIDTSIQHTGVDPFNIEVQDITNINGVGYNYKLVPIIEQLQEDGSVVQIEGDGDISDTVYSQFSDVFLCDLTHSYKLKFDVNYNSMEQNHQLGMHNTIGNKYPIIVSNSNLNYKTSGVHALVLNNDYGLYNPSSNKYNSIDINKTREQREELIDFLTNKQPKILKDINGNIWLVMITGNPQIEFINEYYMGIATIEFSWTEIGNPTIEDDLEYCGLIGGTQKNIFAGLTPQMIAEMTNLINEKINEKTMKFNQTNIARVVKINKVDNTIDVEVLNNIYYNIPVYGIIDYAQEDVTIDYIKINDIVQLVSYYDKDIKEYFIYAKVETQSYIINNDAVKALEQIGY